MVRNGGREYSGNSRTYLGKKYVLHQYDDGPNPDRTDTRYSGTDPYIPRYNRGRQEPTNDTFWAQHILVLSYVYSVRTPYTEPHITTPWNEFILVVGTGSTEIALIALALLLDIPKRDILLRNLYNAVHRCGNGKSPTDIANQWRRASLELPERILNPARHPQHQAVVDQMLSILQRNETWPSAMESRSEPDTTDMLTSILINSTIDTEGRSIGLGGVSVHDTCEWGSRTTLRIVLEQAYCEVMELGEGREHDIDDDMHDPPADPPDSHNPDGSYGSWGWNRHGSASRTTGSTSRRQAHTAELGSRTLPVGHGKPCECVKCQEL